MPSYVDKTQKNIKKPNDYKEKNPGFETVKNSEFLILSTKKYIASYMSEAKFIYESLLKG